MSTDHHAAKHGPQVWATELSLQKIDSHLATGDPVRMIVLSADMRSSTLLMKEAIDLRKFAFALSDLVTVVAEELRLRRGWFDKFTGDGFLAYWIVDDRHEFEYVTEVAAICRRVLKIFRHSIEPVLRGNSRNLPVLAGIALGLDSGPAALVEVAGDMTIMGSPVVGATRMVAAAQPYETIANVHLADRWLQQSSFLDRERLTLIREDRVTKEYPAGQVIYRVDGLCE